MSVVKGVSCFICNFSAESGGDRVFGNGVLSQQLEVIFVLCKVLEVPQDKVVCYLQELPAVEQWIRACDKCGEVVKRCWGIWAELKETQRRFQECQLELIRMIRQKEELNEEHAGGYSKILGECRQFVNEHEYPTPINPFIEGDLIAQEKVLKDIVKTEQEEEGEKDYGWTPLENDSRSADDEISDCGSSENEDSSKSVPKTNVLKLKSEEEEDEDCEWTPEVNDSPSSDDEVSEGSSSETQVTSKLVSKATKVLELKPGEQKRCLVATCSRKFSDWSRLNKHLTSKHTAEERQKGWKLECLECFVLFTSYKSFQSHAARIHKGTRGTRKTTLKTRYVMESSDEVNHGTETSTTTTKDDGTLNQEGSQSEEETSSEEEENSIGTTGQKYTLKRCLVRSCSRKFRGWQTLNKHLTRKHTAEERQNGWKLACLHCPVLFTSYKSLQSHTLLVHKLTGASRKTPLETRYVLEHEPENGESYNFEQTSCEKDGSESKQAFVRNDENKPSKRIPSQVFRSCLVRSCSRKFSSWSAVDKHVTSEHTEEERQQNSWKLACLQCSDLFRNYSALKSHTDKVHNGGVRKGRGTVKTRYVAAAAEVQRVKERKERSLKRKTKVGLICPFCNKFRCRFSNLSKTCRHLEGCGKQSNLVVDLHCPTCKVFTCSGDNPAEFANHWMSCGVSTKVSIANRLFHCKICSGDASWTGKVFFKLKFFLEHYFLHQQLRFECTECGEKLKTMDHSHWHWQKKHTNLLLTRGKLVASQCYHQLEPHPLPEVYWWCPECGTQFLSEDERDQHLSKEHPDQIKYEKLEHCSFCDKQYACPNELKLHQTTTHVLEMGKLIPCHLCQNPQFFLNHDQVLAHRRRFHKNEVLKCQQCGEEFLDTNQLSDHRANCTQTDLQQNNTRKCNICDKLFASGTNLKLHIANVHDRNEQAPCHVCGKNLMHQASLQLHLFKAHKIGSPKLRCSEPGCPEVFAVMRDLREHVIKCHGGVRQRHKCSYCEKDFNKLDILRRHERAMHKLKNDPTQWISCDLCPFKSHTKAIMKGHREKLHDSKNPRVYYLPCPHCGTILKTKRMLQKHIRKEHKVAKGVRTKKTAKVDKPLKPCPVANCPEMFPTVKARMDHLKARHSNQERLEALRVPCSECGKMFAGPSSLRFHKAEVHSHSVEQSFVCDVCGKSYSRYSQLHQHKRKRWQCQRLQLTEEQVVAICEICGLRSRNKFALAEHARDRHSERSKETFRCLEEGCEKVFMRKKNLEWHTMSVHKKGEPQFGCKFCAKRYYNPGALCQHVNYVHRGYRYVKSKQKKPVSSVNT